MCVYKAVRKEIDMSRKETMSEMIVDGILMMLILLPLISVSAIGIFWLCYALLEVL
jgi:hypothetical protein